MDGSKYVWWTITMFTKSGDLLQNLFILTSTMAQHLDKVDSNMDNNEMELIEELGKLISEREVIIEQFKLIYLQGEPTWTPAEQQQLAQLKEWEAQVAPKLALLHASFSAQYNKLQKGKQMTKYYTQGYGDVFTDGAYFDKRK
jgi:hypothetical protein